MNIQTAAPPKVPPPDDITSGGHRHSVHVAAFLEHRSGQDEAQTTNLQHLSCTILNAAVQGSRRGLSSEAADSRAGAGASRECQTTRRAPKHNTMGKAGCMSGRHTPTAAQRLTLERPEHHSTGRQPKEQNRYPEPSLIETQP